MILHHVHLTHVGPFVRYGEAGRFGPGLNVVAAPNEQGKTTLVHAAIRALFDRHSCRDQHIRRLQSAGTGLAPEVTVEFGIGGDSYRIHKRFLSGPSSRLERLDGARWHLLAESDDADRRVQQFLQSDLPGAGATKWIHWGLLGFLWARQGEISTWPSWEGPGGERIKNHLAGLNIDPMVERLEQRLAERYSRNFTLQARPRAGGEVRDIQL